MDPQTQVDGPRSPIDVVCGLIERDGRLLVAKRPAGKALAGKWEFPGGKLEPGEQAGDALRRELREELGIEVTVGEPMPSVAHDYDTFSIRLHPFRCAVIGSGEPVPREHAAVQWCSPEEVGAIDLAAADMPILKHYRARLEPGG